MKQRSLAGIGALVLTLATNSVNGQTLPAGRGGTPPPEGRRIDARDGDLIVVNDDARIRFVRRRNAVVRIIFNPTDRWALLLADFVPAGGKADGRVDYTYNWRGVEGNWPLEERWEGPAVLEEYLAPGAGPGGFGIVVPQGRIQFTSSSPARDAGFDDPSSLAVLRHRGGGGGSAGGETFDQIEPRSIASLAAGAQNGSFSSFTGGVSGGVSFTTTAALTANGVARSGSEPNAPVRTGGPVAMPRKLHDVAAVYPDAMRQSGVGGVVILEVVIAADGSVSSVKVLRGLAPQIDLAALEAAKQWRYEPAMLNGVAVPAVFTATVNVRP